VVGKEERNAPKKARGEKKFGYPYFNHNKFG
jgi:hypothetical protein